MEKGAKIAIGVGSVIAIGIIVYYLFFNKNSPLKIFGNRENLDDYLNSNNDDEVISISTSSNVANPFSSESEVRAFQNYVVNVKKDASILGSYGVDGKWGTNTANAWVKYGDDYKSIMNFAGTETSLEPFKNRLQSLNIPIHNETQEVIQLRFANPDTKYAYLVDYNNEGKLNIRQVNYANANDLKVTDIVTNASWNINGENPGNKVIWKGEVYDDNFYKRPEKPIRKILLDLYPQNSSRWANNYKPI